MWFRPLSFQKFSFVLFSFSLWVHTAKLQASPPPLCRPATVSQMALHMKFMAFSSTMPLVLQQLCFKSAVKHLCCLLQRLHFYACWRKGRSTGMRNWRHFFWSPSRVPPEPVATEVQETVCNQTSQSPDSTLPVVPQPQPLVLNLTPPVLNLNSLVLNLSPPFLNLNTLVLNLNTLVLNLNTQVLNLNTLVLNLSPPVLNLNTLVLNLNPPVLNLTPQSWTWTP